LGYAMILTVQVNLYGRCNLISYQV
jgi:hypothetical protein